MALANPCRRKDWNEWWNKIGGPKRVPWRERMMRWIKVEVREGEEAGVEEHQEEASEEEEANARVEEEEQEGGRAEGQGDEEEEEKDEGLEAEAREEGEDEDDGGKEEEGGRAEEKGEEEAEEVMRAEDKKGELEVEAREEEEETVEKDKEGGRAEEKGDEEEEEVMRAEEKKGELEVEVREEELEEEETTETDEEGGRTLEDRDEEVEGKAEEEEERVPEVEVEVPPRDEEEEEEEETVAKEEDVEEGDHPHDETGGHDGEDIRQEAEEDEDVSESAESKEEDSDATASDEEVYDEDLEDPDEKSSWDTSAFGALDTPDTDETRTHGDRTVSESWTTEEEVPEADLLEEECSDDEEAGNLMDEGEDSEEDEVKLYTKNDYTSEVFLSLKEFRESSLLTDLTLTTVDGRSLEVHSLVLAAVSSLVWRRNLGRNRAQRKVHQGLAGTLGWSLSLGPEVDPAGLEAIVEFAYTGSIAGLNRDNVDQVEAAARALGAPRVVDLCTRVEKQPAPSEEQKKKKEEERTCAAQQMTISLQVIRQLWLDRVGCDVALDALGESLYAHRVVLAASSDYFRSMFTLGMKESHQHSVTLPFLLASELEALIGSSYDGSLALSWSCVFELTSTALQLQYRPALDLCLRFLQQELNPDSCLDVVSFAEAYELPQIREVANDFILRQFQKVAATSKFRDLPARQLLKYLNSRSLYVSSELVVFKAVVSWIQAKPRTRLRLTRFLMKTIHFPLMTFKEFKEVRSDDVWSRHQLEALYEAIFEDFCTDETTFQNRCRVYLPKDSLVLVGGEQTSNDLGRRSISKELWFGNSLRNLTGIRKATEWRRLGEMPEPARFCHEVAVLKGQLYVFGGKKYYGDGDVLNSVYRFDPLQNSWESLADMLEKRSSFSVVVQDGKIFAIGGHSNSNFRDSVERYCPTSNSWSFSWPLDLPLSGHVAKVYQGRIFVSGGRNDDYPCVASMFLYHPETGSSYLANMARPRAQHCMEVLGERLYVAGGIGSDDQLNVVDQLSCEVYDPAANVWTPFAPFPVPHVGAGSAVLEGKFYVLGGYSQEDYSDTNMVHRYDPAARRWENMGKMPGPNNDIRACVLGLPEHFRS